MWILYQYVSEGHVEEGTDAGGVPVCWHPDIAAFVIESGLFCSVGLFSGRSLCGSFARRGDQSLVRCNVEARVLFEGIVVQVAFGNWTFLGGI